MAELYQSILVLFIARALILLSAAWSTAYSYQFNMVFISDIVNSYLIKQAVSFILPSVFLLYILRFFEFKVSKWIQGALLVTPCSFTALFIVSDYRSWFFQDLIVYNQVHLAPKYTALGLVPIFYTYFLSLIILAYFIKTMISEQNVLKIRVIAFLIATALFDMSFTLDLFIIYPLGFEIKPPLVNIMGVAVAMISSERLYKHDVLPSVFETMMEEIGDLVVVTDNLDRVIYLNSKAKNVTK